MVDTEDGRHGSPPPNFRLLDSPNEGDTGTFACPFDGCDGVVCGSADECHEHVKDWHSPPYACAGCDAFFAAQPALTRHVRASGHQKWACAKQGCEQQGVEFESHLAYRQHIIESPSHAGLGLREPDDARSRPPPVDPDETLPEASVDEYHMCLEPCCSRHGQLWTGRMFDLHVRSHRHVAAVHEGAALRRKGLSEEQLAQQQLARRSFLCDAPGCPQFGKRLSTSQSYYHHIQTWNHLFAADAGEDADGDFWMQSPSRCCTVDGCLQFGRRFPSETTYQRHAKSVQHLRAACRQPLRRSPRTPPVNRRLFPPGPDAAAAAAAAADEEALLGVTPTLSGSSGAGPSSMSETPWSGVTPSTPGSGPDSPTPWRPQRELYLERRNRQLEEELHSLQAQMDWLCRQN